MELNGPSDGAGSPMERPGEQAVTHFATMLFFALALIGAGSMIQSMLIDYRDEIMAALLYRQGGADMTGPSGARRVSGPRAARFGTAPRRAAL